MFSVCVLGNILTFYKIFTLHLIFPHLYNLILHEVVMEIPTVIVVLYTSASNIPYVSQLFFNKFVFFSVSEQIKYKMLSGT